MKTDIFLLLGTNEGDRHHNLLTATQSIAHEIGTIRKKSSVYQTEPWGNPDQQRFLNQVLILDSELSPEQMLSRISGIELQMGRSRNIKWGPRVIDIDILFYGSLIVETASLVIPHPGILSRRFTLVPLNEVAADFVHPGVNKRIRELLNECSDNLIVEKI